MRASSQRARTAEAQLGRLARLVEGNADFMGLATPDGEMVFLNHAGRELIGLPQDAHVSLRSFVHEGDHALLDQALAAGRAGGRWEGELRLRHLVSGEDIPVLHSVFPLPDEPMLATIARDLRRQKRDELALRALAEDLEHRVSERTQALQATNGELEAFTYSVSHDLRAPLRHISGFIDLLDRHSSERLDARGIHYVKTIAQAAKQAGQLVDDLLAFSKMGRTEVSLHEVNMNQLVQDCRRELQPEVGGRPIEWIFGALPAVTADPAMMKLVVKNLLSNAIKYTRRQPRAKIEVGCERSATELAFFVRDNGVGFDMQHVNKLFGVFQRLHRSEEFEGSGIGLANVRRIVGRHGGQTRAQGAIGQGATFSFVLPAQRSAPHG